MLVAAAAGLLAAAPGLASYTEDLLPAFLMLGFGIGLVFPAVSITAMSDVDDEAAGLASGMMMTAHEIGAAVGVAVLSAVAAADPIDFAVGYGDGFLVAAGTAAALAVGARFALPVVRPRPGTRIVIH